MHRLVFSILFLALAVPSAGAATELDPSSLLGKIISEQQTPAAALVVVGPEGVRLIEVQGVRRIGSPEEVARSDPWHIGSNAKAMTATLALKLVEEGRVSLDSTVAEVLGEAFDLHEDYRGVTLRQLLSHRAGVVPNAGRFAMLRGIMFPSRGPEGPAQDRDRVLAGILSKPLDAKPGSGFRYSNIGYTIAGRMLEEVAETSFETLIEQELFVPLGMEGVLLGAPEGTGGSVTYGHRGNPPGPAPKGADNPAFMSPAGTFSFTPSAYAGFLTDQLRGQMGLDGTLLAEESYDLLATAPDEARSYGLGWGIRENGWLSHSGSNTMWFATAVVAPEEGVAVAILTNYGGADELSGYLETVISAFGDDEPAPAVAP